MGNPCFFSLSNASRMKCYFGHGLRPHGCAMVLRHGIEQQQRGSKGQGPHGLFRLPRISRLHFRNTYRRERERWIDTIDRQRGWKEGRRETDVEQRSSLPSVLRSVRRSRLMLMLPLLMSHRLFPLPRPALISPNRLHCHSKILGRAP